MHPMYALAVLPFRRFDVRASYGISLQILTQLPEDVQIHSACLPDSSQYAHNSEDAPAPPLRAKSFFSRTHGTSKLRLKERKYHAPSSTLPSSHPVRVASINHFLPSFDLWVAQEVFLALRGLRGETFRAWDFDLSRHQCPSASSPSSPTASRRHCTAS